MAPTSKDTPAKNSEGKAAESAAVATKKDESKPVRPAPQAQSPQAMDVDKPAEKEAVKEAGSNITPKVEKSVEKNKEQNEPEAMDVDKETSVKVGVTSAPTGASAPVKKADPTAGEKKSVIPPKSDSKTATTTVAATVTSTAAVTAPVTKSTATSSTSSKPLSHPPPEQLYRPYLHPDESLTEARNRIRYALEQTRLLRQAFTDQLQERYGVVLQPVPSPELHVEEIDKLIVDPHRTVVRLSAINAEKKKERDRLKQEEGEHDPLASFGGDGLHLVILPEEQPLLYKKNWGISAASAAATDGVLDRVRGLRGLPVEMRKEYVESRRVDRSLNSSPSLSVDSNLVVPQVQLQQKRKAGYSSMLTLNPDGETLLKNKKYNASQMALLQKGVGMAEMKRDPRMNSLVMHQRVIPKEFYETALPPLVSAKQVGRMDVRRVQARRAIRSVIKEIMDREEEDDKIMEVAKREDGNKKSGGGGGNDDKDNDGGGGSSELGLMHRLNALSEKQQQDNKDGSNEAKDTSSGGDGKSGEGTNADLSIDPVLAYSVMSAVGLVNVKSDEENAEKASGEEKESSNSIAKTLGLSKLMNLGPVSDFVKSFAPIGRGSKRKQSEDDGQKVKKAKVDTGATNEKDEVLHIRGGGGDEKDKDSKDKSEKKETSSSSTEAVSENAALTPAMQNQLLQQQSLYNLNSAMGSMQPSLDPYQNALAHQLGISMGTLPTFQFGPQTTPDISEYLLRSQLDQSLLPGQMNYPLRDTTQDAVTAMLLREQQSAAAAVQYQAALQYAAFAGSRNSPKQNNSGVGSSKSQAIDVDPTKPTQRKRSKSMEERKVTNSPKRSKKSRGKGKQTSPLARPSSAPAQPAKIVLPKAVDPKKGPPRLPTITEAKKVKPKLHFTPPEPPKGLGSDIVQLILDAKFYKAFAIAEKKPDLSKDLLIEFLLSLAKAIPIPSGTISEMLEIKLNKWAVLDKFVGESSFASAAREIIVATITVCLWNKNESYYKQSCVDPKDSKQFNINSNAVISFAIETGLHALATYFESQPLNTPDMPKCEIASIVNKSLAKRVVLNKQMVRIVVKCEKYQAEIFDDSL